jgi:protein TonB
MGAVAGIHVAALYLIASSLGMVPPIVYRDPPSATLMPVEPQPVEPLPEPPRVQMKDPPLTVPPPIVDTTPSADTPDRIAADPTDLPQPQPEIFPQPPGPEIMGVRGDSRHPLTQPPYPMSDVRMGNEGFVDLELYVMPNGRVGDVRVLRSTGFPSLDQSAIDEAKRRWKLLPATRDGVPFAQWHRLRVVFKLEGRR